MNKIKKSNFIRINQEMIKHSKTFLVTQSEYINRYSRDYKGRWLYALIIKNFLEVSKKQPYALALRYV